MLQEARQVAPQVTGRAGGVAPWQTPQAGCGVCTKFQTEMETKERNQRKAEMQRCREAKLGAAITLLHVAALLRSQSFSPLLGGE